MADEVSATEGTKRAVILKAARGGKVSIQEMLEAIAQLEIGLPFPKCNRT